MANRIHIAPEFDNAVVSWAGIPSGSKANIVCGCDPLTETPITSGYNAYKMTPVSDSGTYQYAYVYVNIQIPGEFRKWGRCSFWANIGEPPLSTSSTAVLLQLIRDTAWNTQYVSYGLSGEGDGQWHQVDFEMPRGSYRPGRNIMLVFGMGSPWPNGQALPPYTLLGKIEMEVE